MSARILSTNDVPACCTPGGVVAPGPSGPVDPGALGAVGGVGDPGGCRAGCPVTGSIDVACCAPRFNWLSGLKPPGDTEGTPPNVPGSVSSPCVPNTSGPTPNCAASSARPPYRLPAVSPCVPDTAGPTPNAAASSATPPAPAAPAPIIPAASGASASAHPPISLLSGMRLPLSGS